MANFKKLSDQYQKEVNKELEKYQPLRDLDIFVLDNSMRESTVGQLRGHSLESKRIIYDEVKQCGFTNIIVASFSHMTRVDDVWMKELIDRGENPEFLWAFSEVTDGIKNKIPNTEKVPVGLVKIKEAGLRNVIFEVDLGDYTYDFGKFSIDQMIQLVMKWVNWCHENLHRDSKVFVSIRDIVETMPQHSERVFKLVDTLAKMPKATRPFGMMFEEPGSSMPEECGLWSKFIRRIMTDNKWTGHLLVHVHEKFGYVDATALYVLANGADGIWASLCIEGASMGAASSTVTLMNLIRLGNKKVLKKFNCQYLRKAAIKITQVTTGKLPHDKQPIFGTRALDYVFYLRKDEFDMADFFEQHAPIRITTMASAEMIRLRMVNLFEDDPQFTIELTTKMKEKILEDLRSGRREEYMSKMGLALLFDRAGGSLTVAMRDIIAEGKLKGPHAEYLLKEVRNVWDEWDKKETAKADNMLEYDSFYNAFMAPYFSMYRSADSRKALKALDMDADGGVDWNEFLVYLKWAVNEYPDTKTPEELLEIVFQKGIIPAMRDENPDEDVTKCN